MEIIQQEIKKAIEERKLNVFKFPLDLPNNFIKEWNSKERSEERAKNGFFIHIEKTVEDISILSVGSQPEFCLFLIGLAFGVGHYKL